MSLQKTWFNPTPKDHNFIVFNDNTIYRLKTTEHYFNSVEQDLRKGFLDPKFTGLPISYMKGIEYREDDPRLVFFRSKDSEDEIIINDADLRWEIFNYIKTHTNPVDSGVAAPSVISRVKAPMIAMAVLLSLFAFVFSVIYELEQGGESILARGKIGILDGLILGLASHGIWTNLAIFLPLIFLVGFRAWKKYQNNSQIHQLVYISD